MRRCQLNILYIDHYAGSVSMGMEFRPYYMAREWQKAGHEVRIIAASFSHLRKHNPESVKSFHMTEIDGVDFQWVKTRSYHGNGVSRIVTMLQFCWKLYLRAKRTAREFKPDIVIASSTYPMDTYAARRIAKFSHGKYVHEVHDMWPITPIELYGMSPRHPFVRIVQHAEDYFCKKADKVVSILPAAKSYFEKHGMDEDKFVYVPNGIVLSDWENPEELPAYHVNVLNRARAEGRFIIAFFGSHTKSYSLDELIQAFAKIDQSRAFVAFVGEGNYKNEMKRLAKELKISESAYAFLPVVNKRAIPSLLEKCDASYVGAKKNRMFRYGIGMNKLFDAMMAGKPILYAVDAPNDFVEEYSCGISVPAEDPDALTQGLKMLIEMNENERLKMGGNGKRAACEHFTYETLAGKFINEVMK